MYLLKWKEKDWLIIRQSEIDCNTMKKFQKSCLWYKKKLVRSSLSDSVRVEVGCSAVKTGIHEAGITLFQISAFSTRRGVSTIRFCGEASLKTFWYLSIMYAISAHCILHIYYFIPIYLTTSPQNIYN